MPQTQPQLAVALDVPTLGEAARLIKLLGDDVDVYKIGLELFCAEGSRAIDLLHRNRKRSFLDLKLWDIAQTVEKTVKVLLNYKVNFFTIHAMNTPELLRSVAHLCRSSETMPLAVTVLTHFSSEDLRDFGFSESAAELVKKRAAVAHAEGIEGFVCSSQECRTLRIELGEKATLVVPGIRFTESPADDQKRAATPGEAIANGANMLVVGRPIRDAKDPKAALSMIREQMWKKDAQNASS